MCVCVRVRVHVVYVYMYVYVYVCVCVCVVCLCTRVCVYICVCLHSHICVHAMYRITTGPFNPDTIQSSLQLEDPELKVPSLVAITDHSLPSHHRHY